jgi:peptide deformylase
MLIVDIKEIANLEIQESPKDDLIKIFKICQDLEELCEKEKGIGISAIQAGLPLKIFLAKGDGSCSFLPKNQYGYFVNCNYENLGEEKVTSLEGCLSIRSLDGRLRFFQVERHKNIRLKGYKLLYENGLKLHDIDESISDSQQGVVFQHEIDHQLGIAGLISTKGQEVFLW